jgi:putative copper export protein
MMHPSLGLALVVYFILLAAVVKECMFLAPLRSEIWAEYGEAFVYLSLVFVLNLVAAFYGLLRKIALSDTGDKLSHLEKQLRGRSSISEELTERIMEQK